MSKRTLFLMVFAVGLLSGCCSDQVVEPRKITLDAAMDQVGKSLVKLKTSADEAAIEAAKEDSRIKANYNNGLLPEEVDVTLNLTATKGQMNSLSVELTPPPISPVGGKLGDTFGVNSSGTRSNQIVLKFKSIYMTMLEGASGKSATPAAPAAPGATAAAPNKAASSGMTPEEAQKWIDLLNQNGAAPAID